MAVQNVGFLYRTKASLRLSENQAIATILLSIVTLVAFVRPSTPLGWVLTICGIAALQRYVARGGSASNLGANRLQDKVVIVTGGNTGIGLETCVGVCQMGAQLILAVRDAGRGAAAVREIRQRVKGARVTLLSLDLSSRKSIEAFVKEFKALQLPLDILINNAGVMGCPHGLTAEGFELVIGTNYLGHFLLTHLLLDDLLKSKGRLLILTSCTHLDYTPHIDPIDIEKHFRLPASEYEKFRAYGMSKLCNCLHARALHELYGGQGLQVVSLHPGIIPTEITRHLIPSAVANKMVSLYMWLVWAKSPAEGAQTTLHCCVNTLVGGAYYADCAPSEAVHPMIRRRADALALYELSKRALNLE